MEGSALASVGWVWGTRAGAARGQSERPRFRVCAWVRVLGGREAVWWLTARPPSRVHRRTAWLWIERQRRAEDAGGLWVCRLVAGCVAHPRHLSLWGLGIPIWRLVGQRVPRHATVGGYRGYAWDTWATTCSGLGLLQVHPDSLSATTARQPQISIPPSHTVNSKPVTQHMCSV